MPSAESAGPPICSPRPLPRVRRSTWFTRNLSYNITSGVVPGVRFSGPALAAGFRLQGESEDSRSMRSCPAWRR